MAIRKTYGHVRLAEKLTLSIKVGGCETPFIADVYKNIYFKENPPKDVYHGVRDENGTLVALTPVRSPIDPIYFWGTVVFKEQVDLTPFFGEKSTWLMIDGYDVLNK